MLAPGPRTQFCNGRIAWATAVCAAMIGAPAAAAGVPAGTSIENTATATYTGSSGDVSVNSNTVTLRVDELIDVVVAWADPSDVAGAPGATGQVLKFTLTNGGNGAEAFGLTTVANAGGDDFDPTVTSIVLDTNGNGAYDAGVDTTYSAGSNDPLLQPDQSLAVFVVSTLPNGASDNARGRVDLVATAKTGTGPAGTTFAGQGTAGMNAIVGATTGRAEDDGYYRIAAAAIVALVKSATVRDPFGGSSGAPGAVITYRLALSVAGTGSAAKLRIADPIPAGTTYEAGSLTLDGVALSDAADGDVGQFSGSAIAVELGAVPAGTNRTVTFQVKIN